jgi:hypothetical protein
LLAAERVRGVSTVPANGRTTSTAQPIALDRYGHLMPGSEDEAAGLLDAYLERAGRTARVPQVAT